MGAGFSNTGPTLSPNSWLESRRNLLVFLELFLFHQGILNQGCQLFGVPGQRIGRHGRYHANLHRLIGMHLVHAKVGLAHFNVMGVSIGKTILVGGTINVARGTGQAIG